MKIEKTVNTMIGNFILILLFSLGGRKTFEITAFLSLIFLILGIYLIYLTKKSRIKHKIYLYMVGGSGITILISTILHNTCYAIGIIIKNPILKQIFKTLNTGFFILAILITPIIFVIGTINHKKKR